MKNLVLLLSLLLFGCSSCAHHKPPLWDTMGDQDAAYAQQLMRETVQVDHVMSGLAPDLEKSNEKDGLKLKGFRMGAIGTGVVVAQKGKESLIVTAAHVCAPKESVTIKYQVGDRVLEIEAPVLAEEFSVWTMELDQLAAEPLVIDEANDVCVMRVLGKAGDVAPVAKHDPPVGAKVTAVGSPMGFLNYHRAFVVDGRYVGQQRYKDRKHSDVVAVPATHGCSGGGVFYRGELFGVMSRVREDFQQVVITEGDDPLRNAIKKAKENWKP